MLLIVCLTFYHYYRQSHYLFIYLIIYCPEQESDDKDAKSRFLNIHNSNRFGRCLNGKYKNGKYKNEKLYSSLNLYKYKQEKIKLTVVPTASTGAEYLIECVTL